MDPIKSYDKVDREDGNVSFAISRMEDLYKRKNQDDPHRHSFYTVVFVQSGKGNHIVDFREYSLGYQQVFFIAPGQVHQLIEDEASVGFAITFSESFLVKNNISQHFIDDLNLFQVFNNSRIIIS